MENCFGWWTLPPVQCFQREVENRCPLCGHAGKRGERNGHHCNTGKNRNLSRRKSRFPAGIQIAENRQGTAASSRPRLRRSHLRRDRPQPPCANKSAADV